jgi:DNA polymerase-3 subunit epsilon
VSASLIENQSAGARGEKDCIEEVTKIMPDSLFRRFDNIIVLDVETTGIDSKREEIIELAALRIRKGGEAPEPDAELDMLVNLSEGKRLDRVITELTGISERQLDEEGAPKERVCEKFAKLLDCQTPLIVAYNAQFDLCFLYYFMRRFEKAHLLKNVKMLDALTVYKDRRPYPHTLSDAVAAYKLRTQNTHRAIDDAKATLELLRALESERDDLERYINLFGYNPKYGVSGPKISSVKYLPQPYDMRKKLYER